MSMFSYEKPLERRLRDCCGGWRKGYRFMGRLDAKGREEMYQGSSRDGAHGATISCIC